MKISRKVPLCLRRLAKGRLNADYYWLLKQGRVTVGTGTYGLPPKVLHYTFDNTRLDIGSYCSIAGGTTFVLGGEHPVDRVSTFPFREIYNLDGQGSDGFPSSRGDIQVGSDVWIGHGVTILSGSRIGHGAVIGAGSMVVGYVPDYAVVTGVPAKVQRFRFTDSQIAALTKIAWWDWPRAKVLEASPRLLSGDIDGFIAWVESRQR